MPGSRPHVHGPVVDAQTRCIHYRTQRDVIAIMFACCGRFYPCHLCHDQSASHPAQQWPVSARAERAVLCGVCGAQLSINEYLHTDACPRCAAEFNPGCKMHTELYFQV